MLSILLSLIQALTGIATLVVAILALKKGDPSQNDGSEKQSEN